VTTKTRLRALPDVPTLDETVMPGYDLAGWGGLSGPANLPGDVVKTLEAAVHKALQQPDGQEQLRQFGVQIFWGGHDEFMTYVRDELANWSALIKEAGIAQE
jgi:tripartite-type tricarboxylate transporter receptor subunit TctC